MTAPGAVVLHGLTGATDSVAGLAAALAGAGFETEVPMLPGHGTSPEDLATRRWEDWTGAAEAAYQRLVARCRAVVAVGFSMGGALAAALAADHPEVRGLAAINPLIDPPAADFLDLLERFLQAGELYLPGVGNDTADPEAVETAYDRLPVAALLSMSRGLVALHPRLAGIRCPVLIQTSRQDHMAPVVSSDVLAEAVSGPVERVWLERSYHVAPLDFDCHDVERRVAEFAVRVCSELGSASDGQEQAAGNDGRRRDQGQGADR